MPFAKKANDEALGAALQTMSLMVPSPFSDETSPGVAAEIRRLNTALAAGSTPSTASSDPGAASATRKMLTRKPTKTPSSRVSDTLASSSESGDAAASTPSKAQSLTRSLTLKREIEATTPAREVVHRSVSGEAPNTDADATKAPFADDTALFGNARVSIDSPLALSRELALATEKAAVAERVRVYETAESRAALAAVEKKLGDVERDLQKARRETAETARRAASLERTNARLQRELVVNDAAAGAGPQKSSRDALVDEKPSKASKEDHEGRAHPTVSSAALYVDVERLSAELRDTKRRLAEANAASAAADAENKKVFDEMLAAANEVADDLERERARCHRAEHELGKAKATAHARDETRLGEIIEVKSELALAKASLRVEKEKTSRHILAREDHQEDRRPTRTNDSPNVQTSSDATLDARRERERLRLELSEARSAAAKAEARASSACASAAGARTAAALAEAATLAVEARRDGIETKLREDLRAARRTLRVARVARGDTEAFSAVCHEDDEDEDDEGKGGLGVTEGGFLRKRGSSFVSFAKRESNGAAPFSANKALFALVFFFSLASVILAAPFVADAMFRRHSRDDHLGYECAAQWRRTSGVLDEVLSGTLGAPFRRDDVCDVAAPPAT